MFFCSILLVFCICGGIFFATKLVFGLLGFVGFQ